MGKKKRFIKKDNNFPMRGTNRSLKITFLVLQAAVDKAESCAKMR
ncbi:MAG: hypothetical protein AB1422_07810 [bacterium]